MTFEAALEADQEAVVEIMNQAIAEERNAFLEPLTGELARDWYQRLQHSRLLVVAKENGRIVAWGTLTDYRQGRGALSTTAEITFYVHRDHRGQGLGRKLTQYLEHQAQASGVKHLIAILLDDNEASKGLLSSLGYSQWANFRGIAEFGETVRGHLYMGRHLS